MWTQETNQPRIGANPALRAPRIGFAYPHFRNPATLSCSSLIGNVRANPVAAPAAPMRKNGCFLLYFGVRGRDSGAERPTVENLFL